MREIVELPDGARLIREEGDMAGPTMLFIGRLNYPAGEVLRERIAALCAEHGLGFVTFERPYEAACRRVDPNARLPGLPAILRRPLKALRFLADRRLRRYLRPAVRRHHESLAFCTQSAVAAAKALPRPPVLLAGFSQGAIIATALAERLGTDGVLCFGYPFVKPGMMPEAARTAHLAALKPPCLIFQGRDDAYGGPATLAACPLSPAVAVTWLAADHDCVLDQAQWRVVAGRLGRFLEAINAGRARKNAAA